MKRLLLSLIGAVLTISMMPSVASAGVNDFTFKSFEADYYLSKSSDNRSSLKVVEKITAEFTQFDQNKGIERAIPASYDGHSVSFQLDSLLRNGKPEPVYSQNKVNGNVVVATGTEDYVKGIQTYQFTYTLRDVTKDFGDHQEFYWDTNGTEWLQPFRYLITTVHLDPSIRSAFTGDVACYQGAVGSKTKCESNIEKDGSVIFKAVGHDELGVTNIIAPIILGQGENVTMVMKFRSDTFAPAPEPFSNKVAIGLIVLCVVGAIAAVRIKLSYGRSAKGRGTIIPEYLPPKGVSVLLASEISGTKPKAISAQIIDLAVRHKLSLTEFKEKKFFGESTKYRATLLNVDDLDDAELGIVSDLFSSIEPGTTYTFEKTDVSTGQKLEKRLKLVSKTAVSESYRSVNKKAVLVLNVILVGLVAIAVGAFIPLVSDDNYFVALWVAVLVSGVISFVIVMSIASRMHPLTEKGREEKDYLEGLKMYIQLAEADRLKVLQSPQGAEKTAVDTGDNAQLVKLYERVLPYAVLFGYEKEWAKELAIRYDQAGSQPGWYNGTSAFNAATFASAVSGFSSTATSFSSPSSSSSSGFGGGGSGGGGGGGGGGGR